MNFSGADILIVCKDASMQPMRRVLQSFDGQSLDAQAIATKRVRGELQLPKVTIIIVDYLSNIVMLHIYGSSILLYL